MKRRSVLVALAATCAAPFAHAQRARPARVAVMTAPRVPNALVEAFRSGMRELGYIEGRDVEFTFRSAEGRAERFPSIATDIVRGAPDVILSGGGAPAARAAMAATQSIPIVFPASGDPVAEGLVGSLSRPGGNVTGFSILSPEVSGKRVQLIKDLLPGAKRIAIFRDPVGRSGVDQVSASEEAASRTGLQVLVLSPTSPEEYESSYNRARNAGADALIVLPSSSFNANRQKLIALSNQHRLPTVWESRLFTESGGLISYGVDIAELYRASARYVDRILKGAKVAELPVERASKFELVVNLRTANAQEIAIPMSLRLRADRIIE